MEYRERSGIQRRQTNHAWGNKMLRFKIEAPPQKVVGWVTSGAASPFSVCPTHRMVHIMMSVTLATDANRYARRADNTDCLVGLASCPFWVKERTELR